MTLHLAIGDAFPATLRGGAVSVGNFDGVHRGHQALIAQLRRKAEAVDGPAVVVSFDPHPLRVLAPDRFMPLLTPPADRAELLGAAGADAVVFLRTDADLLNTDARVFLDVLFGGRLGARAVVEGFNFAFGRDRRGDTTLLREWCAGRGIACTLVEAHTTDGGEPVSSSRVRHALERGDVAAAAELLGRPYRLRGTVVAGERRGRGLGFPTANLADVPMLIPGDGVYAVRTWCGGRELPGAANVGPKPTFGGDERKVEVHVIGFEGDLYGQSLSLDFTRWLRDTRRFASAAELVAQLREDVKAANEN